MPSLQTLQQQLKNGSAASTTQLSSTGSCARTLCTAVQLLISGLSVSLHPLHSPGGCRCQAVRVSWAVPMPGAVPCHQAAVLTGLGAAADIPAGRDGAVGVEPIPLYRPPRLHHLGKKCGELQRHDRAALGRTSRAELLLLIRHPELSRCSGEPFMEQRSPCREHPGDPGR